MKATPKTLSDMSAQAIYEFPEATPSGTRVNGSPASAAAGDEQLRDQARAELDVYGLSQALAAREIGISGSALSQWLAGKYGGDQAAVAERVQSWLAARAERAVLSESLPKPPGWIETPTAARIDAALSYAQLTGDIAIVYGGAGLGKTMTARHYAAKRPNAWIATMTPATQALSPCLERVLEACGVRASTERAVQLEAALRTKVDGSRGLLIVDEAQHLGLRALEALRGLHDTTLCGLALLGNELIYTRITGGRRAAEFAQLFSRVGKRVRLTQVDKGDVAALLDGWGAKLSGGRELRAAAVAIARTPGGLRGLTKSLRLASLYAEGAPVEARHVRAAWRELGGDAVPIG